MDLGGGLLGKLGAGVVKKENKKEQEDANLKMHVLLIISSKDEAKLADKLYDSKFSKITTILPDQKKLPKDVHAVVAWCGREDLNKIGKLLDNYNKYLIKTILGKQSEDVKNLIT